MTDNELEKFRKKLSIGQKFIYNGWNVDVEVTITEIGYSYVTVTDGKGGTGRVMFYQLESIIK